MKQEYTERRCLRTEDVDHTGRLTAAGTLLLFQEVAAQHAATLGADYGAMRQKSNAYWVLARIRLVFSAAALYGKTVTATTWPLPPSRAIFERDMTVTAENETPVAALRSEWCVLDWDTHRLRRCDSTCFPTDLPFRTDVADAGNFMRLSRSTEGMTPCFSHTVRVSDLDMNRHTNNVVYAKLVLDTFSAADLEAHPVKWLEIHFLQESHEGDTLCVWRREAADGVHILGTKEESGEAVFAVCIGLE